MKKITVLIIIGLSLAGCSSKLTSLKIKNNKTIEGVKIGMPLSKAIEKAKKKFYVEKTIIPVNESGTSKFEYTVYKDESKKTVLFSFNAGYDNKSKDKIFRLVLKNPIYHTLDGVFVGMTLKELKEKSKLKSADFNYNDGLFIVSDSFDGGFLMDISTLKNKQYNFENPKVNTLPGEIKIKEIILF
jgi:hypothetical protein